MKYKFLGRTLNQNTLMYEFKDGSGVPISAELAVTLKSLANMPNGGTLASLLRKWEHENTYNRSN